MNTDDIKHLADLSRLELTLEDIDTLSESLPEILNYVSAIEQMTDVKVGNESGEDFGKHYNVFRSDEVTVEPDYFTEDIMNNMPETEDRFLKVKKILKTED